MAPLLESVYNVSCNTVHLDIGGIGGKPFDIHNDECKPINCTLSDEGDWKIYKDHKEDDASYLLKYVFPNIKLNNTRGKRNGVADCKIRMDFSDKNIRITISRGMHISCDGKFLGVYQPDGNPKYYSSIVARQNDPFQGGLNVEGDEDGDVKEEEDEVKTSSASTEVLNA